MEFDWDEANEAHVLRHGVTPAEVEAALIDPLRIRTAAYGAKERRAAMLGDAGDGRVVFTVRGPAVRVVTARHASVVERRRYLR